MVVSLEEAITILSKCKDDSATILVAAESPFRLHLRGIHDPGVDWTMGIRGRVAQAEFSPGTKGAKAGIVVFEGSSGNFPAPIDQADLPPMTQIGAPALGHRRITCRFVITEGFKQDYNFQRSCPKGRHIARPAKTKRVQHR